MDPLETMTTRWVEAGIIDPDQAAEILAHEARSARGAGVSPLSEALGHLGVVVTSAAAVALVAQTWERLPPPTRVGAPALAAVVLVAVGAAVRRSADRVTGTAWFLAVLAAGATAGVATQSWSAAATWSAATVVATITAAVLWRARRQALQLVAVHLAAGGALVALADVAGAASAVPGGLLLVGAGLAALLTALRGTITPPRAGVGLAAATVLVGAQVVAFEARGAGLVLGVAASLACFAVAAAAPAPVLFGVGAAGIVVFGPQVLTDLFGDTVAVTGGVLLAGVALLVGVVLAGRRRGTGPDGPVADAARSEDAREGTR